MKFLFEFNLDVGLQFVNIIIILIKNSKISSMVLSIFFTNINN